MNNEPVAWMRENEVWEGKYNFSKEKPTVYPNAIPLYTHPVKELKDKVEQCTNSDAWNCKYCKKTETCKALKDPRNFGVPKKPVKELTDEEIISTMVQFDVYSSDDHCLIEAGRAILRKAQNG